MARAFVSPMGDPSFANAAASLAEALFPSAATQARNKMLGAQYHGQLASNEQTNLENVGLRDQNAAYDSMGALFEDPRIPTILRAGRGNAAQLSDALLNFQEQGLRDLTFDRADAAGYGVNAPLVALSNGPVQFNQIDEGYQLDPYMIGGDISATGKTQAQIAAERARAAQFQAGAAQNYAQAGAARALEQRRLDEIRNPGKYAGGGAGAPKPLAAGDSKLISSEILARIPKGVKVSEGDLAAAVGLAESFRSQGLPIGTASARAFDQVFGLDAAPVEQTRAAGISDGLWDWATGVQVSSGEKRLERKKVEAAPPPAQRKANKVYSTPKGDLKWTGTGWVVP